MLRPAPLCPELRLWQPRPGDPFWERSPEAIEAELPAPPWWAFPWAGGQALARLLLDEPALARDREVLSFAAGSGVEAIAAAAAGGQVLATELDPLAIAAIEDNARANGVSVEARCVDLLGEAPPACDLILAGDVYYEAELAAVFEAWVRAAPARVLIGDPGRSWFPAERHRPIWERSGPLPPLHAHLDDDALQLTRVWEMS